MPESTKLLFSALVSIAQLTVSAIIPMGAEYLSDVVVEIIIANESYDSQPDSGKRKLELKIQATKQLLLIMSIFEVVGATLAPTLTQLLG